MLCMCDFFHSEVSRRKDSTKVKIDMFEYKLSSLMSNYKWNLKRFD